MNMKVSGVLTLLAFLIGSTALAGPCTPGRVNLSVVVDSADSLSRFESNLETLGFSSRVNPVIEDGKVVLRASEGMATKGVEHQLEAKIKDADSNIEVEIVTGEICS